jgi:hypothetical protein
VAELIAFSKDQKVQVVDMVGQVYSMPVTPIYLLEPVDDAIVAGRARQLTFPQAAVEYTWGGIFNLWQTDFAPAFSPDGQQVAYLRSDNAMSGQAGYFPDTMTLRIVNLDGSNDRAIRSFESGQYISRLSWSPDGARIVFDMGEPARTAAGIPMQMVDVATSGLYMINIDGSGWVQLRAPAATAPACYTGRGIIAAPEFDIGLVQEQGAKRIVLSWPAVNANDYLLRSAGNLDGDVQWEIEPAQPAIVGNQARVTLNADRGARFYQLLRR